MSKSTLKSKQESFAYEFGGPVGAACDVVFLPALIMILSHWTRVGYVDLDWDTEKIVKVVLPTSDSVLLLLCGAGLLAWFGLLVFLWLVLPGPTVLGAPLLGDKSKGRLSYKLNGHFSFWVVVAILVLWRPPLNEYLFRYYDELAFMSSVLTFMLSVVLYLSSFQKGKLLSKVGHSGNHFYDFWMGRELNPRTPAGSHVDFDWKQFCELRPELIGWMILNLACLQEQYQVQGHITASMWLLNAFQAFYIWDAVYQENAILTTMDITTDGFGFMLVFGDMAWVPFTYTVPAKFLVYHDPHLSVPTLLAIVAVYLFGFYIFRQANGQKDIFRKNPNDPRVAHLSYLQTKRGTRLLTSGWWGLARKVNYTGDYIMGLVYSLLCGFDSLVPYYFAVYFAVLLIHRSTRDDLLCYEKYGSDWDEYKRQVPYRFIPGIV